MLAKVTALAATDVARDVHLSARLCEWEVARTQADLGISTKHLAGEGKEHLLQVGEAYVLIYIETLHLVEEAVGTGADGLVAVYSSWAEHTDRWLVGFHIVSLVVGSMATENYILGNVVRIGLLYKEGILHVAGWMVGSEVKHGKHVLVVIYLRTLEQSKAHAAEDVDNLVLDYSQWVACTESHWVSSAGQVEIIAR